MEKLKAIRRQVDADNSCLFSAIAYVTDKKNFNENSSSQYRLMIVDYLLNNTFDESLLDLPLEEYINEIANPLKWGGGIELKIFSDILKIQIAVVDVQTNRIDLFGQDKDYTSTIYVLYNGIHYDPLVLNFDEASDAETDITIFDSEDENISNQFKELIKTYHTKGEFIDLGSFKSLECVDCNEQFLNEGSATDHARKKNHWNFKQI